MKLEVLPHDFTVCKVADYRGIDLAAPFVFSGALAAGGIGLFAVSTFDTDYILVKAPDLPRALAALRAAGAAAE